MRIFIFLFLCSYTTVLLGKEDLYFKNLQLKDGLSQLSVLDICQDGKGYLWFATRNGLNRYDGKKFQVYRHEQSDSSSLSDNHITVLYPESTGLWIGSVNGLNFLDFKLNKISRFLPARYPSLAGMDIIALEKDFTGRLWVGTRTGLSFYCPEEGFREIDLPIVNNKIPITSLLAVSSQTLLVGTQRHGIFVYDIANETFLKNVIPYSQKETISTMFKDENGEIWVGTSSSGVYRYDRDTWDLIRYNTSNSKLSDNQIRSITQYKDKIIIGSFNGLSVYDLKSQTIIEQISARSIKGALSHYSVFSLYPDDQGGLWVGTYSGGINYHHPLNNRFELYELTPPTNQFYGVYGPIYKHSSGTLYIANEGGGLVEFEPSSGEFENYIPDNDPGARIIKSIWGEEDVIWCGTNNGKVYRFDIKTHKFRLFHEFGDYRKFSVYSILRDLSGNMWFGTIRETGLYRCDPHKNLRSLFEYGNNQKRSFGDIRCMLEFKKGIYMIGTRSEGLFIFDSNQKQLSHYHMQAESSEKKLPNDYISSLLKKDERTCLIGTNGGGVAVYREGEGIVSIYDKQRGLAENHISSLVLGSNSNQIWLSAVSGISCIDLHKDSIWNFTAANGVDTREFTPGGGIAMDDGTILFSSNNGFLRFHPADLQINNYIPPVVFTSLAVNNKPIQPNDESQILKKTVDDTQEIVLTYRQRNFSISYSALNYINQYQNQYAYRLLGHEKDWNYVGNRTDAYYTNINIGSYEFEVIASNNDGLWNKTPRKIRITILAPWWMTSWAYLLYAIVLVSIVWIIAYYIHKKRVLEIGLHQQQIDKKNQEEFYQRQIKIFTSFSHELRIPLMLIISPLEDLLRKSDYPGYLKPLKSIFSNAQKLLFLVNQLLDLQKEQSGFLQIKPRHIHLFEFSQEISLAFTQYAESRQINFVSKLCQYEKPVWLDPGMIEKALFNVLSNAFKFTPEGGEVEFYSQVVSGAEIYEANKASVLGNLALRFKHNNQPLLKNENYLIFQISDTGTGISDKDKEHIFSAFYQGESQSSAGIPGTGIGLSLTNSIIKLHQGVIVVKDNQPFGTILILCIPISHTNFCDSGILADTDNREPRAVPCREEVLADISENHDSEESDVLFEQSVSSDTDKMRILIAEDNQELLDYISQALEKTYTVLTATDGMRAWEIIQEEIPDLVVSDIMMPGMDGLHLCRKIKENVPTAGIPVILMTARSMVMQIKEGFFAGADEYITKPFRTDLLIVRIQNLVRTRKTLRTIFGKQFSIEKMGLDNKIQQADDFMQKFFDIVDKSLSEPELNVEFLSKQMGLSRANFYRKLKNYTEIPPMELIRNKRLEVASTLLLQTEMPISEVALQVGLSTTHFSSSFKSFYGMTPSEYANMHKNS